MAPNDPNNLLVLQMEEPLIKSLRVEAPGLILSIVSYFNYHSIYHGSMRMGNLGMGKWYYTENGK
jgi:hypothetical protein